MKTTKNKKAKSAEPPFAKVLYLRREEGENPGDEAYYIAETEPTFEDGERIGIYELRRVTKQIVKRYLE